MYIIIIIHFNILLYGSKVIQFSIKLQRLKV